MRYRVRVKDGSIGIVYDLGLARAFYCISGHHCDTCRLFSKNQKNDPLAAACSDINDDELLRRFGDDIEIIHDEEKTAAPVQTDAINPGHYRSGKVECIDAIESALAGHSDPVAAYLTGQALKYLWRWPLKNRVEDLKKAKWYLERLIEKEESK